MSSRVVVEPQDEWNERLVRNVHPPDWRNPTPSGRYDLVVVGAGTGGLITALVASSLGARVALVERHLMGGDCLNVGCVPSKALIRAARQVHSAREAAAYGLPEPPADAVDFKEVMRRVREIRARISHEDSAERYAKEFGIDVFLEAGMAGLLVPFRHQPTAVDAEALAALGDTALVLAAGRLGAARPAPAAIIRLAGRAARPDTR